MVVRISVDVFPTDGLVPQHLRRITASAACAARTYDVANGIDVGIPLDLVAGWLTHSRVWHLVAASTAPQAAIVRKGVMLARRIGHARSLGVRSG
jgi:hypothetical protein